MKIKEKSAASCDTFFVIGTIMNRPIKRSVQYMLILLSSFRADFNPDNYNSVVFGASVTSR